MSGFWLATYVALWSLVLVLAAGFVALYHHFGQMYMNTREGRANHGPEVGSPLQTIRATTLTGEPITLPELGTSTLIVVSDTMCPLCQKLQPALNDVAVEFEGETSVIVLCSGRRESDVAAWGENLNVMVHLVADHHGQLESSLGVGMTPFVVAVDATGIVRGRGIVNDLVGLREAAADAARAERPTLGRPLEVAS